MNRTIEATANNIAAHILSMLRSGATMDEAVSEVCRNSGLSEQHVRAAYKACGL